MTIDDVIALLTQWKETQNEVVYGRQSHLLSRDERNYHRGIRDAYAAILAKIEERNAYEGVV